MSSTKTPIRKTALSRSKRIPVLTKRKIKEPSGGGLEIKEDF